ncbi:hypothetical protein PILCRDRAFT_814379 [Piloderma croceum F 1598]|uniref:Uncharacterized protein n=1 Tax=Piloderma croceum (strain F 1598) TaxID=765440 RepID=A0A0C3BPP6_PILCF|nr:hypothetical protein PILCRDRAFT_814379 [Piloderma croceum F 1598]
MEAKINRMELSALHEKDTHMAYVENQLQAYISRTCHIQARLLSTLDALDALQALHNRELASEIHAKTRLSDKLDRYINFVHAMETEKEDLRDAVVQLVEKVEMSNNYSLWPHSHIRSTHFVEPLTRHPSSNSSEQSFNDEVQMYATAIISSLRSERDLERNAHEQTRHQAECRIIELEAQLARRDAELAARITHTDGFLSESHDQERKSQPLNDHGKVSSCQNDNRHMTKDEAIQVMEATSARNKTLEQEVQGLFDKLQKTRLQSASRTAPATLAIDSSHPDPLSHSSRRRGLKLPRERCISSPRPHCHDHDTVLRTPHNVQYPHPIHDLDHHIETLASEVTAFQSERNLIAHYVAKERQSVYFSTNVDHNEFERVLLIEEECIRLADSERRLRGELEAFKDATVARETELKFQIDKLRKLVHKSPPLQDLLGNPNGEQFMELVTPLHDSAVLPANTLIGSSESSHIDAPSIPLPPSPLSSSSPLQLPISSAQSAGHSQPLPQPQSSRISKVAQMSRIEDGLLDARRDLKDKETALNELRAVVEGLRQQAVGRGPHGGSGELDNVL